MNLLNSLKLDVFFIVQTDAERNFYHASRKRARLVWTINWLDTDARLCTETQIILITWQFFP